jgi:antitoxin component YwqK of YwqJK toxin-antitoxin module
MKTDVKRTLQSLAASGLTVIGLLILCSCVSTAGYKWEFIDADGCTTSGVFSAMPEERTGCIVSIAQWPWADAVADRDGKLIVWDGCGRRTETTLRSGKREGEERKWSHRGVLISQGQWVGDQLAGQWRIYYPSGRRQSVLHYDKGTLHGVCSYWAEMGEKTEESEYSNGTWSVMTTWYTNGLIQSEETEPGSGRGRSRFWTPDGQLVADGQYRDGKRWEGTFLGYGPDMHEWTSIMTWHEGELLSNAPLKQASGGSQGKHR